MSPGLISLVTPEVVWKEQKPMIGVLEHQEPMKECLEAGNETGLVRQFPGCCETLFVARSLDQTSVLWHPAQFFPLFHPNTASRKTDQPL